MPQSQLTGCICAPALDGFVVENRTGMIVSRFDCPDGFSSAQVNSKEVVSHKAWIVSSVVGMPQSQLAISICAPALDWAVVQHEAVVRITRSYWNYVSRIKSICCCIITGHSIACNVWGSSFNSNLVVRWIKQRQWRSEFKRRVVWTWRRWRHLDTTAEIVRRQLKWPGTTRIWSVGGDRCVIHCFGESYWDVISTYWNST